MRLDLYEKMPTDMKRYLSNNGWHFNKKMCAFAVSMMRDRNGNRVSMKDKEELCEQLRSAGIDISADGYDAVYLDAMARADYLGGCLSSDNQVALFISDYLTDDDGYVGMPMTRFYADCIAKGKPIFWEDML